MRRTTRRGLGRCVLGGNYFFAPLSEKALTSAALQQRSIFSSHSCGKGSRVKSGGYFGPRVKSLVASHGGAARSRLEPQEARTMTVTKQASAPVYLFLVGAVRAGPADENNLSETSIDPRPPALASRPASCSPLNEPSNPDSFPQIIFFSACVAGLVVSAARVLDGRARRRPGRDGSRARRERRRRARV